MSKDLFGAEIPEIPAMDAPLPYVVWRVTTKEHALPEYWAGRSEPEIRAAVSDCDLTPVEIVEATTDYADKCMNDLRTAGYLDGNYPHFLYGGDQ